MSAREEAGMPRSVLVVLHVEKLSGPQRSLEPRLGFLRERGTRITTLLPRHGPAADVAASVGEVAVGMPGALLVPRSPLAALRATRSAWVQAERVEVAARATGADIVIVTSARMPGALRGARRAGAGVILYAGESLAAHGAQRLMGELAGRLAAGSAHALLVPSRYVSEWYEARGVHTHVVNPPIAPPPSPEEARKRGLAFRRHLGIGPQEALVGALGAITRGRGQDLLVRALAHAREASRPWRLVIGGEAYGRPSDLRFAQELFRLPAELGVASNVVFAGRVDDANAFYAATDLFVNPARAAESFGRAACEALAMGCPVVTTRVGGVAEALEDGKTALFTEPDDPESLETAIWRVLDDAELRAALATQGRSAVRARFAPEVGNPCFEDAIRVAMASRSR